MYVSHQFMSKIKKFALSSMNFAFTLDILFLFSVQYLPHKICGNILISRYVCQNYFNKFPYSKVFAKNHFFHGSTKVKIILHIFTIYLVDVY